jgi:hypothetical protein
MKPTGVYLAPKHVSTKNAVDLVLWLHGWYVKDHKQLFHSDEAHLRDQVLNSGKDAVLIAPFLGQKSKREDTDYDLTDLKGAKWGVGKGRSSTPHRLRPEHPPAIRETRFDWTRESDPSGKQGRPTRAQNKRSAR